MLNLLGLFKSKFVLNLLLKSPSNNSWGVGVCTCVCVYVMQYSLEGGVYAYLLYILVRKYICMRVSCRVILLVVFTRVIVYISPFLMYNFI